MDFVGDYSRSSDQWVFRLFVFHSVIDELIHERVVIFEVLPILEKLRVLVKLDACSVLVGLCESRVKFQNNFIPKTCSLSSLTYDLLLSLPADVFFPLSQNGRWTVDATSEGMS